MDKKFLVASMLMVGILMASTLVSANWFTDLFNSDKDLVGQAYSAERPCKRSKSNVFSQTPQRLRLAHRPKEPAKA